MSPGRADGYLTTAEAARFAGVSVNTIYTWRNRGHLVAQGLDERGYPLHTREAVRAAERRVRENGIEKTGIDPRQLRQRAA
ncbi:MAG TPA: helix-turn-helix domain-containing protein [Streptosporangiaceae bacterium]|nr:helix-turn-helix domain-containing protein [Streptosporangiaceae bacterium]